MSCKIQKYQSELQDLQEQPHKKRPKGRCAWRNLETTEKRTYITNIHTCDISSPTLFPVQRAARLIAPLQAPSKLKPFLHLGSVMETY